MKHFWISHQKLLSQVIIFTPTDCKVMLSEYTTVRPNTEQQLTFRSACRAALLTPVVTITIRVLKKHKEASFTVECKLDNVYFILYSLMSPLFVSSSTSTYLVRHYHGFLVLNSRTTNRE